MSFSSFPLELVGAICDLLPGNTLKTLMQTGDATLRRKLVQGTTNFDLRIYSLETFPSWAFNLQSLRSLRVCSVGIHMDIPVNPTVLDFLPQEVCYSLQTIDFGFVPATRLLETASDGRTLSKMCPNLTSLALYPKYGFDVKLLRNLPPHLLALKLISQAPLSISVDLLPRSLTSLNAPTHTVSNEGAWPPFLTHLSCSADSLQTLLQAVPRTLEHLTSHIPSGSTLRTSDIPPGLVTLSLENNDPDIVVLDAPLPPLMRSFLIWPREMLKTSDREYQLSNLALISPSTLEELLVRLRSMNIDLSNKRGRSIRALVLANSNLPISLELLFPSLLQHYSGAVNHRIEQCIVAAGIRLKSLTISDSLSELVSCDFLEFLGKSLVKLSATMKRLGMFTDEFYERKPLQSYNTDFKTLTLTISQEKSNSSEKIARFWSNPLLPPSCTDITIQASNLIPEVSYFPLADWRKFENLGVLRCNVISAFTDSNRSGSVCDFQLDPPESLLPHSLTRLQRVITSAFTSEMIRSLPRSLNTLSFILWESHTLNSWTLDHWKSLPPRLAHLFFANRQMYQPIEGAPSIAQVVAAVPQTLLEISIHHGEDFISTKAMEVSQQYD